MKQSKWVSNCLKKTRKVFGLFLASFFMAAFFSHSAFAASDISISSSGIVSIDDIQPSSTGTLATGEDNLSVSTTCIEGANVYASSVNDNSGNNGGNNSNSTGTSLINLAAKAKDSEGTSAASYTINTSSAAIGSAATLANNTWGLNTNAAEAAGGLYYGLPAFSDSTTPTAIYTGTATSIPVYFGVRVTSTLVPGTYTGQVLYTATVNTACLNYTVTFNKNSTTATGSMEPQTILPAGGSLRANSFEYPGYTFLGWSTNPAGKTGTATNGIGTAADVEYGNSAIFPDSTISPSIKPGDSVTLYAIWKINSHTVTINKAASDTPACSATVHPTATTGCKMADGRVWIYGNSGNAITWNDMFTGATGANNHDATVNSGICPAGYSAPKITDFDSLIIAYGGTADSNHRNGYREATGALHSVLGLSNGYGRGYWSSTEYSSSYAYFLYVSGSRSSNSVDNDGKAYGNFVLCYQEDDSPIASVSGAGTYNVGDTVTISATAKTGYRFSSWTVNSPASGVTLSPNNTTSPATFTMPDSDVTLTANGEDAVYFQTASCSTIATGTTGTLTDSRDNQDYTVYRFGSSAPSGMSNYCLMTKDLSLGYVTGGSVTKGANLTLTANDSASAGTITARTGTSNWSSTNSDDNLQYINGPRSGYETYSSHSYYSYGAAQKVCPKGWRLPTRTEYRNIATFMGGDNSTGSAKIGGAPYVFVYGGTFSSGGWNYVGSSGYYWSSSQSSSTDGYYLGFDPSGLVTYGNAKYVGRSVRCVSN